jgi:endonuclease/exonuclease/phosphatase (EEP) superfamily protein YafD
MKELILIGWSILVILAVSNLFEEVWWILDLLASFRVQIAFLLIAFSAALCFYKKYILTAFGLLLGLWLVHAITDTYQYDYDKSFHSDKSVKMLSINLLSSNHEYERVKNYIERSDADFVALVEYTPSWDYKLSAAFIETYPHQIKQIRTHNFGIAFWSKHAIESYEIFDVTDRDFPMIEAELVIAEKALTITSIHLENPIGMNNTLMRNHQVNQLIQRYKNHKNLVLIGDYNMTPYAHDYTRLRELLRLEETRCDISPTFPVGLMPLGIPIDHCLVSKSIEHSCLRRGPEIGSDHFPIEIVLSLQSEN